MILDLKKTIIQTLTKHDPRNGKEKGEFWHFSKFWLIDILKSQFIVDYFVDRSKIG